MKSEGKATTPTKKKQCFHAVWQSIEWTSVSTYRSDVPIVKGINEKRIQMCLTEWKNRSITFPANEFRVLNWIYEFELCYVFYPFSTFCYCYSKLSYIWFGFNPIWIHNFIQYGFDPLIQYWQFNKIWNESVRFQLTFQLEKKG